MRTLRYTMTTVVTYFVIVYLFECKTFCDGTGYSLPRAVIG